jgi:hypothetical protein
MSDAYKRNHEKNMKRATVLLFLICFTCFMLFSQKEHSNQKEAIVFTALTYDYGTIGIGSPGKCEFKFTNTMKKPLVIHNVKPSCGCTVANWPKEPIMPGKTGVIKLDYNTKIPGTFNKTITVSSNAANSTVIIHIKGNVTRYN